MWSEGKHVIAFDSLDSIDGLLREQYDLKAITSLKFLT